MSKAVDDRDVQLRLNFQYRLNLLGRIAILCTAALLLRVLVSIVLEYRFYFPADFASTFLTGRESTFVGIYVPAFYIHIIAGPLAVVIGTILLLSGGRTRFRHAHRLLGRSQMIIVLIGLVPSGFVMASRAFAGPIAGLGFASLSAVTGVAAVATLAYAINKQFLLHRRWATRCYILLCSPLLLRVVGGGLVVFQLESDLAYRLNAWLSWLVPLAIFEIHWRCTADKKAVVPADRLVSSKMRTSL